MSQWRPTVLQFPLGICPQRRREQNRAGRSLRTLSLGQKSSHPQVHDVTKGRQDAGMAKLQLAGQTGEPRENTQAVEAGTGDLGEV